MVGFTCKVDVQDHAFEAFELMNQVRIRVHDFLSDFSVFIPVESKMKNTANFSNLFTLEPTRK